MFRRLYSGRQESRVALCTGECRQTLGTKGPNQYTTNGGQRRLSARPNHRNGSGNRTEKGRIPESHQMDRGLSADHGGYTLYCTRSGYYLEVFERSLVITIGFF